MNKLNLNFFFCKDSKKGGCYETCKNECLYNLRELENKKIRPKQKDIRSELVRHGHASYRTVNNKAATTDDQCNELINHYRYAHKL